MVVVEFTRSESESLCDIEAMLQGQVFHVTKRAYWKEISELGAIVPNSNALLPTTFGVSKNSYFRNRGCVSLFDYREPETEEIKKYRSRCDPMQAAEPGADGISILIFEKSLHARFVSWEGWKKEAAYSEMIVPYVEAGHRGGINIDEINKVIHLCRTVDHESLSARLRNAYLKLAD